MARQARPSVGVGDYVSRRVGGRVIPLGRVASVSPAGVRVEETGRMGSETSYTHTEGVHRDDSVRAAHERWYAEMRASTDSEGPHYVRAREQGHAPRAARDQASSARAAEIQRELAALRSGGGYGGAAPAARTDTLDPQRRYEQAVQHARTATATAQAEQSYQSHRAAMQAHSAAMTAAREAGLLSGGYHDAMADTHLEAANRIAARTPRTGAPHIESEAARLARVQPSADRFAAAHPEYHRALQAAEAADRHVTQVNDHAASQAFRADLNSPEWVERHRVARVAAIEAHRAAAEVADRLGAPDRVVQDHHDAVYDYREELQHAARRAASAPAASPHATQERPKAIHQTQHGTATTHTPHDQAMSSALRPLHAHEAMMLAHGGSQPHGPRERPMGARAQPGAAAAMRAARAADRAADAAGPVQHGAKGGTFVVTKSGKKRYVKK